MSEPLHHKLQTFNFYPSRSLHPSWWPQLQTLAENRAESQSKAAAQEGMPESLTPEQLDSLNTGQPYLVSSWLLKQFNLDGQFDFNFDSPEKQLFLQSPPELQRLRNYLTALLYHPFIASLLAAKKVKAIKQVLGDEGYQFAVKQAPLLLNQIPEFLQKHMTTTDTLDFSDPEKLDQQLNQAGAALLATAAGQYGPALQWRLYWKLPFASGLVETKKGNDSDKAQHKLCWQLIKKVSKQFTCPNTA
ncbi:SctK family type III secretion system sorting platform protein [Thalassomonas actiniarum]|uniref:SctK family type III secretion system sorting platform protein n=1 Tax=Thalassomonas actiniarum TaxID=485447 RepID=A0AAE9YWM1_9GAMM|nr:SctK family type III secretion system sorting platform protein [Thalassomonas actiniarum]WDE02223.1 SctK family type III secretion system sorting platform protein [Thalassomonas actiniarum]